MGKKIILLFMLVFMFSLVSAVAPVTTIFAGNTGIHVEVNIMDSYQLGETRWTVIHLFNESTGDQITNITNDNVTCEMHLRNSQGFEIMKVLADTHDDHWDLNGSGAIANPAGTYAWTLVCQDNTANVGGYASGFFDVTTTGRTPTETEAILYTVIIVFLVFIFSLLLYAITQIPKDTRDDEGFVINVSKLEYIRPVLKGLAWILLTSIMFIISNIAIAHLSTGLVGSFLFGIFTLMMLSNLVIIPLMIIRMIQRIVLSKDMLGLIERGVKF